MEARQRRPRPPTFPDRRNRSPLPPPGTRKAPVVYYLCRNRQLDHPHFIEVPLSSPDGLYLRDVISQLNVLRGHVMPTMYSWSCKRSYKNGFVWQDLTTNDLIIPADGCEYILKGSEILGRSSAVMTSDCPRQCPSNPHLQITEQRRREMPISPRTREAWTKTDDVVMYRQQNPSSCFSEGGDNGREEITRTGSNSSSPTRRMNTLESLIRDEVCRRNNYEIFGKEKVLVPMKGKLKSVSMLMQLITCGSFLSKEHCRLGPVWAYNPRFSDLTFASPVLASSVILGELDFLEDHANVMETKQEERRYCSGRAEHKN